MKNTFKINKEYEIIHKKYFPDKIFSFYYPELKNADLLFVGLNPSFSEKAISIELKKILNKQNKTDEDISIIQKHEEDVKFREKPYQYFSKFVEISNELNLTWEHIDLFLFRKTSQKEFIKLIKNNKEYVEDSFKMFFKVINIINPKLIIVNNAFASKLISERHILNKEEFLDKGFFNINGNKFIFTSMLTGQRALDLGSLLILKFHIKTLMKKINKKVI